MLMESKVDYDKMKLFYRLSFDVASSSKCVAAIKK